MAEYQLNTGNVQKAPIFCVVVPAMTFLAAARGPIV